MPVVRPKRYLVLWVTENEHASMRRRTPELRAEYAADLMGMSVETLLDALEEVNADIKTRSAPDVSGMLRRLTKPAAA